MEYCIYKITNTENNKVYIGQTYRPKTRYYEHNNYEENRHLRSAFEKYGKEYFTWEILYEGLSKEQADVEEERLISEYNSTNDKFGYNIQTGGAHGKHNEESRRRMSEAHIGIHPTKETCEKKRKSMIGKNAGEKNGMYGTHWSEERMKKHLERMSGKNNPFWEKGIAVSQYDKDGDFIAHFPCIKSAQRATGIRHIHEVVKGQRKSAGGYLWKAEVV